MFRTLFRFSIAVLIGVGATLGWQSYGDEAKEMLVAQVPTLGLLLPVSTTKSPSWLRLPLMRRGSLRPWHPRSMPCAAA
jgi:hypothetical protein